MLVWTAILAVSMGATPVIQLRPSADVASDIVLLSDIADISAPSYIAARLARIDVTDLRATDSTSVSRSLIALRLQLAGYSPSEMSVSGANTCYITRAQQVSLPERVMQMLRYEYAEALDVSEQDIRVKLMGDLRPPHDDESSKVFARLPFSPSLGVRHVSVNMASRQGSKRAQMVKHLVEVRRQVPVLRRDLKRGDPIMLADIQWHEKFVQSTLAPLTDDDLEGKVVVRDVEKDEVLSRDDFRSESAVQLVAPRARVTCVLRKGSLTMTMKDAVAITGGARRQSVRLKNPTSREEFTGVVVGANQVEVLAP